MTVSPKNVLNGLATLTLAALAIAADGASHRIWSEMPAGSKPASEERVRVLGTVPRFRFTSQTGAEFGSKELDGRVWIATFIFTRCAQTCPLQMKEMSQLDQELGKQVERDAIRFVGF